MPYEPHPLFELPPLEARIWRYLDLGKYLSMLRSGALYFARTDRLGDPFEGSLTKASAFQLAQFADELARQSPRTTTRERIHRQFSAANESIRRWTAMCCWHESDRESWAMWRTYGNEGVAIVSTPARLIASLVAADDKIFIGRVRYVNYDDERAMQRMDNIFSLVMTKRDVFESERELRCMIARWPTEKGFLDVDQTIAPGIVVHADVSTLLSEIRISPMAPEFLFDVVEDVTQRYGLSVPVHQSSMSGVPIYGELPPTPE